MISGPQSNNYIEFTYVLVDEPLLGKRGVFATGKIGVGCAPALFTKFKAQGSTMVAKSHQRNHLHLVDGATEIPQDDESHALPILGRKIRFALVGCGRIAENHFRAIKEHHKCGTPGKVGICDVECIAALIGSSSAKPAPPHPMPIFNHCSMKLADTVILTYTERIACRADC